MLHVSPDSQFVISLSVFTNVYVYIHLYIYKTDTLCNNQKHIFPAVHIRVVLTLIFLKGFMIYLCNIYFSHVVNPNRHNINKQYAWFYFYHFILYYLFFYFVDYSIICCMIYTLLYLYMYNVLQYAYLTDKYKTNVWCVQKWNTWFLIRGEHVIFYEEWTRGIWLGVNTWYLIWSVRTCAISYKVFKQVIFDMKCLNTWYFKRCVWTCDIWYEVHKQVIFHMKCLSKWYLIWSV
jgi:hypothetical protein